MTIAVLDMATDNITVPAVIRVWNAGAKTYDCKLAWVSVDTWEVMIAELQFMIETYSPLSVTIGVVTIYDCESVDQREY